MIYAIKKNSKKALSPFFNSNEFDCKCNNSLCVYTLYSLEMITLLERLRAINEERPLLITCGYRCYTHNASVNGKSNSQHLVGLAVDLACPPTQTFESFKNVIYKIPFKFILCYPEQSFIHVDLRTGDF